MESSNQVKPQKQPLYLHGYLMYRMQNYKLIEILTQKQNLEDLFSYSQTIFCLQVTRSVYSKVKILEVYSYLHQCIEHCVLGVGATKVSKMY